MTKARASEFGFTLVEVLMVVFIIGLASGFVIMNLPERASPLEEAADFVRQDVETLQDRAILTGIPHAIEISQSDYKGVVLESGEWRAVNFSDRELTRDVTVTTRRASNDDEDKATRFVFDPSGAPTHGVIVLSAQGRQVEIALSRSAWELSR